MANDRPDENNNSKGLSGSSVQAGLRQDADLTSRDSNKFISSMQAGLKNASDAISPVLDMLQGDRRTVMPLAVIRHRFGVDSQGKNATEGTAADQEGKANGENNPSEAREHSVLVNKEAKKDWKNEFPVMKGQRELAKQELDANEKKWGSGNFTEQEKKSLHDIQNALLDGRLDALTSAIQGLGNNPEKLSEILEEAQRNIKLAGGNTSLALSDGKAYIYAEKSKNAVQIDPKTGNTAVRPISRNDGVVTLGAGEVISSTANSELRAIADETVRGVSPLTTIEYPAPPKAINMPPLTYKRAEKQKEAEETIYMDPIDKVFS